MGRCRFLRSRYLAPLLVLWVSIGSAAARTPKEPTPEETAWNAARTAVETRRYDDAERLIVDALAKPKPSNDRWYWEFYVLRGRIFCWKREYDKALEWLRRDLPPALKRSPTDAKRSLYIGFAHALLRDGIDSAPFFDYAKAIAARHPGIEGEVYLVSSSVNASGSAQQEARKAADSAAKYHDDFSEAMALNNLGYWDREQEKYPDAIYSFEKALELGRKRGLEWLVQKVEGNLGWTYLALGDYETAAELFESAQRTAARLDMASDLVKWTNQRGNTALQMRDYETARAFCSKAVELSAGTTSADRGHALANLARIAIEQRRPDVAEQNNNAALEVKKANDDTEGIERSRILAAEIAALRGHHDEAIATLDRIASKAQTPSVRWEAQARLAQVLLLENRGREADSQFREAIRTVRNARKGIDEPNLRVAFFRVAEDVFDAYVDFLVSQKKIQPALEVTELIRAATLQEGMGLGAPKSLDLAALARARQATILCYWLGREKSYVWVITAAGVALRELPRERVIESEIDGYRRLILDPRVATPQLAPRGTELYRMLVGPAEAAIPMQSRVVVIPDGRMHVLNMESLMVPGPKAHFWIENVTVISAASLQLLTPKVSAGKPKSQGMLLIGNPLPADPAYPPLSKAKTEIDYVRRHFPQRVVLEGRNATPAAYAASKPDAFEYLHFVAHGEATLRKPLDAAVILGRGPNGAYKLFARDIVRYPLNARLVTVSSCHGAGTRPLVGEGLVGLTWAFLGAGAQQVIAALWEVSDNAAPRLMNDMYGRIRGGADPATALRQAKLKFVRANTKPFYWAPFVLYGM